MFLTVIFFLYLWQFFFEKTNMEFDFFSLFPFSLSILMDFFSFIFFFTIFIIFFCIFFYSFEYMQGEVNLKRFFFLLFFFVFSMILLIFSGGVYTSFISWDFLGMSSLLLIFFFQNHSALKAGVLTFVVNRFGDCLLMISILYMLTLSLNMMNIESFDLFFKSSSFFFLLMGMTKSAQLPFSSWLPAAMQAPTPVSSLVHSSTLVTAGFFMLFRYFDFWSSSFLLQFLFVISLSTTFMASFSALDEMDLKKVIALSTLSHLGFIMLIMSMNLLDISFFYMVMHAFFKALLFMTAGIFIHYNTNIQDIRKLQSTTSQNPIVSLVFLFSILSMSGFPFLTGFFSKDIVLDMLFKSSYSFFSFFLIMLTVFLTILYSFRILFFMMPKKKSWNEITDDSSKMWLTLIPLLFSSVIVGSIMSWFFFKPDFFFDNSKKIILAIMAGSLLFFWCFFFFPESKNIFSYNMWFITTLTEIFFILKFKWLKKMDLFSDLQGFQGNLLKKVETIMNKSDPKFSQYFLGNMEYVLATFFIFISLHPFLK